MPIQLLKRSPIDIQTVQRLADDGRLYALLDACDAPAVPTKAAELGEERAVSLYRGMAEEEWSAFAPYLAQVDVRLLDWIQQTLWSEPWGLFVVSSDPLAVLRSHFRRFLIVDDPDGEEMYFRFYDPRVLQKYLPTCTDQELKQFFGTNEAFLFSAASPSVPSGFLLAVERIVQEGMLVQRSVVVRRVGQHFPIRAEQMAAFQPEGEAAFEMRVIRHLREHHPETVVDIPEDVLLKMVRTGIARGRQYGMRWESNLTAYVSLMFVIAPNFDQHPRMQTILSSRQIPPEEKLDRLIVRTPDQTWEDVRRHSDPDFWLYLVKEAV